MKNHFSAHGIFPYGDLLGKLLSESLNDLNNEEGSTTIEYAMGALAAAALAGALYLVVTSGTVSDALQSIISNALNSTP